jgi:predicted membrane protein
MILSVLGGTSRRHQRWDARVASPSITVLGGTDLDFTLAELGEGETEVVVASILGGVEIVVPDDLPVFLTGLSALGSRNILGSSEGGFVHGTDQATPDFHTVTNAAGATGTGKRLRLSIFTALGGVEVRRVPVSASTRPMEV